MPRTARQPVGFETFHLTQRILTVHAPLSWKDNPSSYEATKRSEDLDKFLQGKIIEMRRELASKWPELWLTWEVRQPVAPQTPGTV